MMDANQPETHDEQITEAWLLSIGFKRRRHSSYGIFPHEGIELPPRIYGTSTDRCAFKRWLHIGPDCASDKWHLTFVDFVNHKVESPSDLSQASPFSVCTKRELLLLLELSGATCNVSASK